MPNVLDTATDTISNAAGLNEDQKKLVRMGLLVATGYVAYRVLRNLVGRKQ